MIWMTMSNLHIFLYLKTSVNPINNDNDGQIWQPYFLVATNYVSHLRKAHLQSSDNADIEHKVKTEIDNDHLSYVMSYFA